MNNKRRNYLINPKFQLKFGILASIIIALCCSIYPLSFYNVMSNLIETLSQSSPDITNEFEESRKSIFYFFIKWQIIVSLLIFAVCIFFSHKIAGPIYRIRIYLKKMKKEGRWESIKLRKGDYFLELADDINQIFEKGNNKSGSNLASISEINSCLNELAVNAPQDKKDALNEVITKLSEVQKRFEA